jgi:RNA polymerase sigma-70 factor (ECF subfamily)
MDVADAELVAAVRSGRREAFEELVRRYAARIYVACRSRLGRRGPVEDMVQEAFLRGYRAIGTLSDPGKFGSWLYGIAVRACLDWLKARERSQVPLGVLAPDQNPEGILAGQPRSDPEEEDRRSRLLVAVEGLPEIYREVVMMFYYRRQSYREMSAMLGITPAAINARLSKARALLREDLARAVGP